MDLIQGITFTLILLVSPHHAENRVEMYKNSELTMICERTDSCVLYCYNCNCRSYQRFFHNHQSVQSNDTHWWVTLKIAVPGFYNCYATATSSCTVTTSTVYVSLYELNNTVVEPTRDPIEIREGETLSVNCSVESFPNVTMTWVTPRDEFTILNTLTETLVVDNTTIKDSGVYECSVWNDPLRLRSVKYFNVSVMCAPRPHDPRIHPNKIWFTPGETINLKAEFIANPQPVFKWKKKTDLSSHTIEGDGERVLIKQTKNMAELMIIDTVLNDRGLYRVEATNGIGELADLYFTVTVLESTSSTVPSVTPAQAADAEFEDGMMSVYIGVGVGVPVLLLVVAVVFICRRRCTRPENSPSSTELESQKKGKPKSLNELSLARRKPQPPPRAGISEVPRYSTQVKAKKRGGVKGRVQEESYEQPSEVGEAIYQQDMYEDLKPNEYYNH